MLHGVHARTAHLRPGVALHLVLVEVPASLQDGLVHAPTSSTDADHCAALGGDCLSRTRGQTNASLLAVVGVTHDHA